MGVFKLATLLLLSVVLTSQRVYGQEDIVPIFTIDEDETYFNLSGNEDANAFPPEISLDDQFNIQCPSVCECSQDEKADGTKITADCSAKELENLPEIEYFDSKTNILLLNGNQLVYLDSAIAGLKELEELNLDDNEILNIATGSISELPELRDLSLANNKFDAFPRDLQLAKTLTTVDLSGNYFSEPVTAEDFSLLSNISSIVLPSAAPSLIIQLCEYHNTLKQVCTESCDTDVNECAKSWATSSEDVADNAVTQTSIETDPSIDIEHFLSDTSLLSESKNDIVSTEEASMREDLFSYTSSAEKLALEESSTKTYISEEEYQNVQFVETAGVETTDTPVTEQSLTEIPTENGFEQPENSDTAAPVEETSEVYAAEKELEEGTVDESISMTETPDEGATLEETEAELETMPVEETTLEAIVKTSVDEGTDEASVDEFQIEETPEENNISVEPLGDETPPIEMTFFEDAQVTEALLAKEPEDETFNTETPVSAVTVTPNEEKAFEETPVSEEAPLDNIVFSGPSTEISFVPDEAPVATVTFAQTIRDEANIASSIEPLPELTITHEEPTTPEDNSGDANNELTLDGTSTERSSIDDTQVTGTPVTPVTVREDMIESNEVKLERRNGFVEDPTEPELNGDFSSETTTEKNDKEGLLLSLPINSEDENNVTTNVNEETATQSIETGEPSIMGSVMLSESDPTEELAQNTTENVTGNVTGESIINKGGVDNTIIALVIACMVCVVAGVTIRKNWSTIKKKIRPRSRPPTADTTNGGISPEEVPLKDKSPV